MKLITFTILAILTSAITTFSQDKSFKELHKEASEYLMAEAYREALPSLLKMEELDPKNYNTLSSIGYCYLQSEYDKSKSVGYFEKVLADYKNLTIDYRVENHKEKKAPVETIYWMGQAYHYNYQFDEALEKYREFKDLINTDNKELIADINKKIKTTRNAMAFKEHPVAVNIDKLTIINTEFSEYRPKINGDETEMYFTSRRPVTGTDAKDFEGRYFEDIFLAKKVGGVWQKPVYIKSAINSESHDACLFVSPDGQSMIIYRTSLDNNNEGGIYQTQLEGDNWTEPKLMIAEVNSDYWETDANISADGQTLFYTSDKPGGVGGRDIWQMKRLPNGEWAKVQNLGNEINTPEDEEAPYLHPDGKTLFFSSKGNATMGGFDVFQSELQADGTWSTPKNLGYPINTTGDDVFYFPTTDGKRAYFSSYREGGQGRQDIYMIEMPTFEEKTLAIYKGLAKYSTGEVIKDLSIDIVKKKDLEELGTYRPNNTNGHFLFLLQPGETFYVDYTLADRVLRDTIVVPNTGGVHNILKVITVENDELVLKEAELVNGELVVPESDILAIAGEDITSLTDTEVKETLESGKNITLNNLYFVYDRDKLINDSKVDLSKVITYMKNHPGANIVLEGHTDYKGEEDYNMKLSNMRCKRVRNKLVAAGIKSTRISTKGFGETKPVALNENPDGTDNPEGRQLNRRVEIRIDK